MDPLLAIYPTARKVDDLLKRQSREGCQMGHRVVTFPQLVDALWREYGADRVLLSAIGERIAIEEAIVRANNIGDIAGQSGLADYLHALARQVQTWLGSTADLEDCPHRGGEAQQRPQCSTTSRSIRIGSPGTQYTWATHPCSAVV